MELLVQRLHPNAKLPTKAYPGDAGFDLYSVCDCCLSSVSVIYEIDTGIAIAIPKNYYGQLMCRSSLGKQGLRIHHGVIDSGYRGPVTVLVQNCQGNIINIRKGDRIAQLLILPVPKVKVKEVAELPKSRRGTKGFGSSGR